MARRSRLAALVTAVLFGAAVASVYAYDSARSDLLAEGVRVGGMDVGGMRASEARDALERRFQPRLDRVIRVQRGERTFAFKPVQVGARLQAERMVSAALRESRDGGVIARTLRGLSGRDVRAAVPARVTYSRRGVAAFATRVKRVLDRPSVDARLRYSGSGVDVVPGRSGLEVDRRGLQRALAADVAHLRRRPVEVPVRSTKPAVDQAALRDRHPYVITVDRSAFRLHLFKRLRHEKTYVIAVGKAGYETPTGLYPIQNKAVDPVWSVPNKPWAGELAGTQIPAGPDNPLKARWMGIYDGAGIHGTDETETLGTAASHGCIRMSIPDVKDLYRRVGVGTPVYIE